MRSTVCVGAAVVVAALAVGACGSSSHPTSTTTGGTSATNAPPSASSGGGSAQVAAAKAAVAKDEQIPTTIPVTQALKSPAPKGKTIVFLQCEVAECHTFDIGVEAAAKAVGWTVKTIPFTLANSATLISAMNQALQYKPVAVAFSGPPEALWKQEVPAYDKAGVPLIPSFVGPVSSDKAIIGDVGETTPEESGRMLAEWIIADSNGKANILLQNIPQTPYQALVAGTFKQTIQSGCSACKITEIDSTVADEDAGTIPAQVVSALQKDPSVNYVFGIFGPIMDDLPSQLQSAGLNGKVKVVLSAGDIVNEADLRTGTVSAVTGEAAYYSGWADVDVALRHLEGMTVPASDEALPIQLLVKSNLKQPSASYDYPTDYPQEFEKLWHVS